jgi:DNA-binding MarR family transcriptional regulator
MIQVTVAHTRYAVLPIEDADYRALADFRRALREFSAFSEAAARDGGLTPQQHQAILAIRAETSPVSIGELAEALQIRPNSAQELVSRLVRAGLVERIADSADRRRIDLRLTAEAGELLESLSAVHLAELRSRRPLLQALLRRLES